MRAEITKPDLVVGPSWLVRAAAVITPAIFIAFIVAIIRFPRIEEIAFLWTGAFLALALTIVAYCAQRMRLTATEKGLHFRGPVSQSFHPWSTLTVASVRRDAESGIAQSITVNAGTRTLSFGTAEFDSSLPQLLHRITAHTPAIEAASMHSSVRDMSSRWITIVCIFGVGGLIYNNPFGAGALGIASIILGAFGVVVLIYMLYRKVLGLTLTPDGLAVETFMRPAFIPWDRLIIHRFEQSAINEPITFLWFGDGSRKFTLHAELADPGYQSIAKAILERSGMYPLANPSQQPTGSLSQ